MKRVIELQNKKTWTKELKEAVQGLYDLDKTISKYKIVGYHYTNLINVHDIIENGIKILDVDTIKIIKNNLRKIYPKKYDIISNKIDQYIENNNFDNRKGTIYFCCDNKQVNNGFNYIFDYYGGEITYNSFNNKDLGINMLLDIGKPYIIKFLYEYNNLVEYKMKDLKIKLKDKYLQNKKIDMDCAISKEILPEDIIGLYKVNKKDNKYYVEDFIINERFNIKNSFSEKENC